MGDFFVFVFPVSMQFPLLIHVLRTADDREMMYLSYFGAVQMQDYHPTRDITLAYLPFVLCTTVVFAYHEAKIKHQGSHLSGILVIFVGRTCTNHCNHGLFLLLSVVLYLLL